MSCVSRVASLQWSPREPDFPREQEVRFWNNKVEVPAPPLSPISCSNLPSKQTSAVVLGKEVKPKPESNLAAFGLVLQNKLGISTERLPSKEDQIAAPPTPRSVSSQLSDSFVSLTLGKMATLKQNLQEGTERVPSPARDDALDAAMAQQSSGKVQKQVSEIERKREAAQSEGGFLGKMFRKASRSNLLDEPTAKVLSRKTSPPSPAGMRSNGLPPKRALSPQPFRVMMRDALGDNRSQSAFQARAAAASPVRREPEKESAHRFSASPTRDSASRHTKEWVNALKPPGIPPKKEGDGKTLRERRSHAVAVMQSAHSHQETASTLLDSPTVSASEDEDMWDMPGDADRLSSNSTESSESDHLTIDRKEIRRSVSVNARHPPADLQSAEFQQMVQRQRSFDERNQRARSVERRPGAVVDGRSETMFKGRDAHTVLVPQWKKDAGEGIGAHSMGRGGGAKAMAGLSADAVRNRQSDSPGHSSFGFAFDNAQFSDRVLVLEISPDVSHDMEGNKKDSQQLAKYSPPVRKPIHINSAIVAVKSNFFFDLLGQHQQHAPVMRIRPEDEAPVLDMLRFMYSQSLQASAPEELAQVLIVSDRYGVSSCFKHTFRLLSAVPMDALSSCLFLDLPRHLKDPNQVQNLVLSARSWLVVHFRELEKKYRTTEFMGLSLMGVRTILESHVLHISSEVTVFNALVNWSRHHFPDSESQRAKVVAKLAHLVRFPFMTTEALRQALDMPELNSDVGRGLIVEALFFKAEPFFKQRKLAETEAAHSRYVPRSNDSRVPVTIAPMDESGRQASLFLELPRTQFQNLQPGARISSKAFLLGGQTLSVVLYAKPGKNAATEGVIALMIHNGVASKAKVVGEFEFFTRFNTMDPFQSVSRGKLAFKSGKEEQAQSSVRFPEDKNTMIHIRADLTIKS